jgi:hypothetical protein
MNRFGKLYGGITVVITLFVYGCGGSAPKTAHHDHDHDHDHAAPGPHGGHLIELGDEAFHGELTHNDPTHKVTVYLLDGAAKATPAATDLPAEVKLTVIHDKKPNDFTLKKSADGQYDVVDESLCTVIGGDFDVEITLAATIAGLLLNAAGLGKALVQAGIHPLPSHQLVVRAPFDDPPLFQDQHQVGVSHGA